MKNRLENYPLQVIFFTIFVDLLGVGILIPVIPQLLANPTSQYFLLGKDFNIQTGYILLGYLTAVFSFAQFLATPILGQLSDKYGRKMILSFSLLGTCLGYILFALGIITRNLPLLFLSRAIDGITGGNISVAQAAIADITKPEDRARNFGMIGAAFGLGFIIGPYIGGKLSDPSVVSWFNATTPFLFAALLSLLNVVSILFFFPETLKQKSESIKFTWNKSIINIVEAFKLKHLKNLFLTIFLFQSGFTFFTTFFSVYLITKLGFSQGNIGDFFAYVGLWIAITQALVTRQISKRFKEVQILRYSLFVCAAGILLYLVPTVWWGLLFVTPIFAIANGLTQANMGALVSRSADPSIQGEVLGINASVQALAMSIPPVLSGYIAASITPSAPVYIASFVILLSGIVFWFSFKPADKTIHSTINFR